MFSQLQTLFLTFGIMLTSICGQGVTSQGESLNQDIT